jgi:hypothetical protein
MSRLCMTSAALAVSIKISGAHRTFRDASQLDLGKFGSIRFVPYRNRGCAPDM